MRPDAPLPPPIAQVGATRAAARLWRSEGRTHVTVVVKASFALVPGAAMLPVEPDDVVGAEVHHQNNPVRSVRLTTDLAPLLPRADVLLTGHAWAPQGRPVPEMAVRLALFRERPLLNKVIRVRGDAKGGEPAPFERMPLVYERAFGGIGFEENPLGVGAEPGDTRTPNLVHPQDPRRVACFGPISRAWPARKRLLAGADRRALDAPIAELPADFGWSYWSAAPPDQQVDSLQGDEWIQLDGLHPEHTQIQSYLPYARGLARVVGLPGGEPRVLTLDADTLRIDADALRCTVTWRGSFPAPDERALAGLSIEAGVETYGRPVTWAGTASAAAAGSAAAAAGGDLGSTVMLGGEAAATPAVAEVLDDDLVQLSTVTLNDDAQEEAAAIPAAPFRAGAPSAPEAPAPPAPPPPAPAACKGETLWIMDEAPAPPSLPFHRSAATVSTAAPAPAPAPALVAAPTPARAAAPASPRPLRVQDIALRNETPLALSIVPWDLEPSRACLTVVAKATCDLVPGGPAKPRAAPDDPLPEDRALFKARADVVLTGHAYAPGGEARASVVRFAFGHEGNRFAREILVFGARVWTKGVAGPKPSAPEPFQRIPLTYESAFGGPGHAPNPLGVGRFDPMRPADKPAPLPHLEDPARRLRTPRQEPPPACPAPIPRAWKAPSAAAPWPQAPGRSWPFLPEDLDWTHYQVAPPAQQLGFLDGDEPFAIEGVHPRHARIGGALPGLRARCFAERQSGAVEELPLRLDTVAFDADALAISLVWRGILPIPDERAPDVAALLLLTGDVAPDEVRTRLLRR